MAFPNSRGTELEKRADQLDDDLAEAETQLERQAIQIESLKAELSDLRVKVKVLEATK